MSPRVIAVDWSGAKQGACEKIWLAEAIDGRLTRLENGRDRDRLVDELIRVAGDDPELVVGIDFAFSLPERFMREQGFATAEALWRVPEGRIEAWLEDVPPPFYGKGGRKRDPDWAADMLRETDRPNGSASPFLIAGSKQVGTGSLRGFAHLARLRDEGFRIWPFDEPSLPLVIEIYPGAFTRGVVKSRRESRAAHVAGVQGLTPSQRAAAEHSDDAFDAALSALEMSARAHEFVDLRREGVNQLEGAIWSPPNPGPMGAGSGVRLG